MKALKIFSTGLVSLGLLAFTACNDYLDINDNPNYPTVTDVTTLLPSGIAGTAAALGAQYQLIGSLWSQHYTQGHTSNQYNTLCFYNVSNSSEVRMWRTPYTVSLPDLDLVIKTAEENNQWNYWAIAKVMTVFNYHMLVDTYGSIPFTEALKGNEGIYNPKYDDSKTVVYPGLIAMLDEVIAKEDVYDGDDQPTILKEDFLFGTATGNDMSKWVSFAKSLKLKLLMRDFEANKTAIQTLLTENDFLTVDAKMDVFVDAENGSNPLYENDRRKLNSTVNLRACNTLSEFLLNFDDPRAEVFYDPNNSGDIAGLDYGYRPSSQAVPSGSISVATLSPTDAVYFMSAAEVAFLKAEAYARLGNANAGEENYNNGVTLAFSRWGLDVSSFIAAGGVYEFDSATTESMLTSILTQKWIAATHCQAWDAWCDINRTGIPALSSEYVDEPGYVWGELTPCFNSVLPDGEFPRRMLYPKESSDNNSNTPAVVSVQTKQWWHK